MKNVRPTRLVACLCLLALVLSVTVACGNAATEDVWKNAVCTSDTECGNGEKTLTVRVEASDRAVTFTVHTDGKTVGDALLSCGLIDGDEGPYGLYVKTVNGITADYDVNGTYWGFFIGNDMAPAGVDMTEIEEGITYRLVYTK